jgi:hypothetical protein
MMSYAFPLTGQTVDIQQGTLRPCTTRITGSNRCCSSLGSLIVSLSDGSLSLLRPSSQGELTVSDKWHAHDHEPWIAAWDYWDTSVLYSGMNPSILMQNQDFDL